MNCVMKAFSCLSTCSATCGGGTCDAKRSVQTAASGGGSCTEENDLTRTDYECNAQACAPATASVCDSTLVSAANVSVTSTLTLVSGAWPSTESSGDFVASVKTAVAEAAGLCEKYVTVATPVRVAGATKKRRALLQDATVTVVVTASFQVGASDATKYAAMDASNKFVTQAKYMTDWILPVAKRDVANAGTATVAVAGARFVCPASVTYASAVALATAESYTEASRALNDIAYCLFTNADAKVLDVAAAADVFNMLGFATRKSSKPDTDASELYYKRALQINPAHQGAVGYLGELYVQTNRASLARESLDKLKIMCPPPNDCDALGVLRYALASAGMIEGALVRVVDWTNCFANTCSPMNITVGDSLNFRYGAAHDVVQVSSADAFNTCASGDTLAGTSQGADLGVELKFETVGVEYLICSQSSGAHCAGGQKMVVNVHTARDVPSIGGAAPSYSLEAVESSAVTFFTGAVVKTCVIAVAQLVIYS